MQKALHVSKYVNKEHKNYKMCCILNYIKSAVSLGLAHGDSCENTNFTSDMLPCRLNNSSQPLPMVLLSVRGGWTWRVKNIMEVWDRYVTKSLCRRAAMAASRREAARSAVGAFTRLWLRSWREGRRKPSMNQ